ncbi:acyl-CoA dehydrogenase family protein [Mycolicibacterium thermoresistibile]|uniref:Acyl-CoA dehydrogenase FadE34 n=2 Tax=Mycolicibacterium thermoresistibile TaxID=1797 RepID=G7CH54_MYCT3|nr:acyl-CoA dehydrogenase family protein [Mycolicibacterium thermoresistibile]EHI12164.1 acyl-CoA dehydrogenase FadE34 [Mycolicibacterium thermoresistibile ATCC 19527]MCV7191121.1 acyl-CoA/acyl-ACP dehydrogenase [Mycolicibacterium thermoresistibile]GAT15531.1 acyl-CoA dehydrogenase FadE34 [Mycolicibacterium thermoresistibile]SNW16918.1 acyl-CoA dehydrogenase [Mycolicibacterium thermoresistibile]
MHFALSEDQQFLQKTAEDIGGQLFGDEQVRSALTDDGALRSRAWQELASLDLLGLLVPEDCGGAGGSLTDACLVAEALGRRIAPVPYVSTAIAAAALLVHGGGDRQVLADLCSGAPVGVLLDAELDWPEREASVSFGWGPGARGVAVVDRDRVDAVELSGAGVIEGVDPLHPVYGVDRVDVVPGDSGGLRRARAIAWVGAAAALTGIADGALRQAVEYAKQREQYGRPIGSFQAIQHICADMLVAVETARSVTYGASWEVEHAPIEQAERIGAAAKAHAATAAIRTCENGIQVLGGIGVTWEHDAHLRLRTAHTFADVFGDVTRPLQLLAATAFDSAARGATAADAGTV